MKIEWILHNPDESDPEDPVGDILITNSENFIEERDTYIDSWLEVLIAALRSAERGQPADLDIWEEPEQLTVQIQDSGLKLSYRDGGVFIPSTDEFYRELRAAIYRFLDQVSNTGKLTTVQLDALRKRFQIDDA